MPAVAGILPAFASAFDAPLLPLRYGARPFVAVGDGFGSALTAASSKTSPKRDLSPGSRPLASSGRDTGGLAALPPAPTPPFTRGGRLHPAPRLRDNRDRSLERGISAGLRPPLSDMLSRRAAGGARSRCAARASVVSRATP